MVPHSFAQADESCPGSPSEQSERIYACAAYITDMIGTENDYHSRRLIAITVSDDPWYHITRDVVQETTGTWLGIPRCDFVVDFYPPKGFLLLLPTPALRDRALACSGGLPAGPAKLQLLLWTRMAGAEVAKLCFKVPLCIEGVPLDAHQSATIQCLLPPDMLLEGLDHRSCNVGEASCCCVVVWARNPNEFAMEGCPALRRCVIGRRWYGISPTRRRPPVLRRPYPRGPHHSLPTDGGGLSGVAAAAFLLLEVGFPR
jgi:hypothetical protein